MNYEVKWIGSDVIITFKDQIVFNDIYEINSQIYGDPRFETMNYQLVDLSLIKNYVISETEMQLIGQLDKSASRWNDHLKIALVSTHPDIEQFSQVYAAVLGNVDWEIRIFSKLSDAKEWCQTQII